MDTIVYCGTCDELHYTYEGCAGGTSIQSQQTTARIAAEVARIHDRALTIESLLELNDMHFDVTGIPTLSGTSWFAVTYVNGVRVERKGTSRDRAIVALGESFFMFDEALSYGWAGR